MAIKIKLKNYTEETPPPAIIQEDDEETKALKEEAIRLLTEKAEKEKKQDVSNLRREIYGAATEYPNASFMIYKEATAIAQCMSEIEYGMYCIQGYVTAYSGKAKRDDEEIMAFLRLNSGVEHNIVVHAARILYNYRYLMENGKKKGRGYDKEFFYENTKDKESPKFVSIEDVYGNEW